MHRANDATSRDGTAIIAAAFGGLFAVVGCGSVGRAKASPPIDGGLSLFERLGGMPGLRHVVRDFLGLIGRDCRINTLLTPQELRRLGPLLVGRLAEVTGGPSESSRGRTAQAGLLITMYHLQALVDDLTATLQRCCVPERESAELLALLAPAHALAAHGRERPRPKAEAAL